MAFYEDPNQQGSIPPCMFLQTRYNYTTLETGGLWRRRLGLDLTYLEDYNLPDLQQRYQRAGETLDLLMETFPYSDGETAGTILLRAHEREWRVDLDALHYRFELLERVSIPEEMSRCRRWTTTRRSKIERQKFKREVLLRGPRFAKYQQDFLGAVLCKSEYTIAEAERAVKAFFKDKERD